MKQLKPIPKKVTVTIDSEEVFIRLVASPTQSQDYECTHEEARVVYTWVRTHTEYGLSQKAYKAGQKVLGYTLALTTEIKKRRAHETPHP